MKNTVIKHLFEDKRQEKLLNDSFELLRDLDMYEDALSAYHNFMTETGLEEATIIENAFLLLLTHYAKELEEITADNFHPESIKKIISNGNTYSTTILNAFGSDYLGSNGADQQISNDLYAANIAITALSFGNSKSRDYIGLIGDKAFTIAYQRNYINKTPYSFNTNDTSAEAKLLHLVQAHKNLNNTEKAMGYETSRTGAISIQTAKHTKELLNSIYDLNLHAHHSALEQLIISKCDAVTDILQITPVNHNNVIVSFPSL